MGQRKPALAPDPVIEAFFKPSQIRTHSFTVADARPAVRLEKLGLSPDASQHFTLTLYDSFDWRLHKAGFWLAQWQSKSDVRVLLGTPQKRVRIQEKSSVNELNQVSAIYTEISPLLRPRVALTQAEFRVKLQGFNWRDKEQKILARCFLTTYLQRSSGARQLLLCVHPLRGYVKASRDLLEQIKTQLERTTPIADPVSALYELAGVQPGAYSAKPDFLLDPADPATEACRRVLLHQLKVMRCNETGLKHDLDSEFLHDYRVAVRRSRSLLARCAQSCPPLMRFGKSLQWLGQITGPTRDLDVYLLAMPQFRTMVPEVLQGALEPLQALLERQQGQAHKKLIRALESIRYQRFMQDWEFFLKHTPGPTHSDTLLMPSIGAVAGEGLWRVYKKVRKQGRAITEQSPPEALHRLRKTCKKLRYIIDTLPGVYDPNKIFMLMPVLKNLQSLLGDYQDCSVQIEHLTRFAAVLHEDPGVPVETSLALGAMIAELDRRQHELRTHFAEQFADFDSKSNQVLFRELLEEM